MAGEVNLYRVSAPEQLRVVQDDLLPALLGILKKGRVHEWQDEREALEDLQSHCHPRRHPDKACWLGMRDGHAVAFISVQRTGTDARPQAAITWAWSKSPQTSRLLYGVCEDWAAAMGVKDLYITRRTKLKAFTRLLKTYGYAWDCAVFRKRLGGKDAKPLWRRREAGQVYLVKTAAVSPADRGHGTAVRHAGAAACV